MSRNQCIYEIKVRYTKTVVHYDQCQERTGEHKEIGTTSRLWLIADKFYGDHTLKGKHPHGVMIEAWVTSYFRFQKEQDFEILWVKRHDISGILVGGTE